MRSTEEVEKVVREFEETVEARRIANGGEPVGCVLCRHEKRKMINRAILAGDLNDNAIGRHFGYNRTVIVHHRLTCLPKYGGATTTDTQRFKARKEKLFPAWGKPHAQKKWFLDELMFLRDDAMKKQPVDRKELLRLAKEINVAAAEYQKALAAHREDIRKRREQGDHDEDFTPEQKAEMSRVNGGLNGGTEQVQG